MGDNKIRGALDDATLPKMSLLSQFPHFVRRERELSVARLASTLTHSLGTPLQVIAGRAALAMKASSLDDCVKHVEIIQRKCGEITNLLWRVLEAARIEQERTVTQVDILAFVQEMFVELGTVGQSRGVQWRLERVDESADLSGRICAQDLCQALLSLALNLMAETPDRSTLVLQLEKIEEPALARIYEATFRFRFSRAIQRAPEHGEDGSIVERPADPWLSAQHRAVDGQSIGWAAVYELARGNEAVLEVTDREVRLDWPVVAES